MVERTRPGRNPLRRFLTYTAATYCAMLVPSGYQALCVLYPTLFSTRTSEALLSALISAATVVAWRLQSRLLDRA